MVKIQPEALPPELRELLNLEEGDLVVALQEAPGRVVLIQVDALTAAGMADFVKDDD